MHAPLLLFKFFLPPSFSVINLWCCVAEAGCENADCGSDGFRMGCIVPLALTLVPVLLSLIKALPGFQCPADIGKAVFPANFGASELVPVSIRIASLPEFHSLNLAVVAAD